MQRAAGKQPAAGELGPAGMQRAAGKQPAAGELGRLVTGQTARLTAWVEGRVQGVGFRWWVRARALERGLAGVAENLVDGRVRVIAEGSQESCSELLALLAGGRTPGMVRRVTHRWDEPRGGLADFTER